MLSLTLSTSPTITSPMTRSQKKMLWAPSAFVFDPDSRYIFNIVGLPMDLKLFFDTNTSSTVVRAIVHAE